MMTVTPFHVPFARTTASAAILLVCFSVALTAQSGYDLTVSTEPYTELESGTSVGIGPGGGLTGLDFEGAAVPLYGEAYTLDASTPLLISGTGFLRFDKPDYSVVIDGFLSDLNVYDERSGIFHDVAFEAGENILKVEWRQAALIDTPDVQDDFLNFQIWIYQTSGVVELRYGPSKLNDDYGTLIGGGPFVGIFRFRQTPSFRVLQKNWLLGDPADPYHDTQGQSLGLLGHFPPEGTVYRFRPNGPSAVDEMSVVDRSSLRYSVLPNVVVGELMIEPASEQDPDHRIDGPEFRVIDVTGKTVAEGMIHNGRGRVSMAKMPAGLYFCVIQGEGRPIRVMKK